MKIQTKTLKKVPLLVALAILASLPIQSLITNFTKNDTTNQVNAFEALSISQNQGATAGGTDVTISGLGFDEALNIDIVQVSASSSHSLALSSDGKVYAWGHNSDGALGDGSTTARPSPVAVDTTGVLKDKIIVAVSAGTHFSLALGSDGKVYAWGNGWMLGYSPALENQTSPIAVNASGVLAGKTITDIAAGPYHSLALDSTGNVYSWGDNTQGQLGDGTTSSDNSPIAVDVSGVLAGKTLVGIAAGYYHSAVLDSNGKVYAWGYGVSGQLGNGTSANSLSPVAVNTAGVLSGKTITTIAAGDYHSLALDSDGKVYAWGYGNVGQLGNSDTINQASPVAVDTSGVLAGKTIVSIAAGSDHSLALDSDGKVYAWGRNTLGQLGDGIVDHHQSSPVTVDTSGVLAGKTVTAITAGSYHSLALDSNGKIYAWGSDNQGQLGNGATTGNQVSPVTVDTNPATSALGYVPGPISVTFDPTGTATECTNVVLVDENTITCTTSAHIAGTVDVLVSDTVRTSTLKQAFTYKDITPEVPDTGAK